jgi:hypothetical protein
MSITGHAGSDSRPVMKGDGHRMPELHDGLGGRNGVVTRTDQESFALKHDRLSHEPDATRLGRGPPAGLRDAVVSDGLGGSDLQSRSSNGIVPVGHHADDVLPIATRLHRLVDSIAFSAIGSTEQVDRVVLRFTADDVVALAAD